MAIVLSDRVPVMVHAHDEISRAGMLAQLRYRQEVRLVDSLDGDHGVVLVVADEIDEQTLRAIRAGRHCSAGRVVLVVTRLDDAGLLSAVEAGVSSLLLRSSTSVDSVITAVRSAAQGAGSMPPDLLGRLLDQVRRLQRDVLQPRGIHLSGLTDREIKVLRLVAEGHGTSEVGRRLFCSERTVKNVIHDITTRLQLQNRTHAVAYAMRQGLI